MDITPRKRAKIVALSQHSKITIRKIGEQPKVSKSTVGRIVKLSKSGCDVTTPKRRGQCGRKRKATPKDDKMILRNSVRDPTKNSKDLQRDLATAGVNVDSSTVRRRLLQAGRKARRPLKNQLLTAAMKKKRMKWAKKYNNWRKEDWRKVIFSDESHFEVHGPKFAFVEEVLMNP